MSRVTRMIESCHNTSEYWLLRLAHLTLQHTATHCNTLQHTATHCNTLQHTTTHIATHCNELQQVATWILRLARLFSIPLLSLLPFPSMRRPDGGRNVPEPAPARNAAESGRNATDTGRPFPATNNHVHEKERAREVESKRE